MPNFDKTGPAGAGARTGGQMGKCATTPGSRPFDGRGKGMGKRPGRGRSGLGQGSRNA